MANPEYTDFYNIELYCLTHKFFNPLYPNMKTHHITCQMY